MSNRFPISRLLLSVLVSVILVIIIQDLGFTYRKEKIYFSKVNKIKRATLMEQMLKRFLQELDG